MGLLKDGYQTLFTTSLIAAKMYKIVSLTPPPIDGRGPIDQTNMESAVATQKSPKALIDMGNFNATIVYDTKNYDFTDVNAIAFWVNVNGLCNLTFPDGTGVNFWGYINAMRPGENAEGNRPTAVLEIVVTNEDNSGNQVLPDWVAAA
jgi:hypothetical protein